MKFLPIVLLALSSSSAVATEESRNLRNARDHVFAESRIVGGTVANIDAYPFFVSWGGCGASLIGKEWLLTAAHCAGISTNSVKINESRKYGTGGRGVSNTIARRIPHPQYDSYTTTNDFMLMRLQSPVTDNISPLDLNMNDAIPANDDALKVIGFGTLSSGGSAPSTLQEVVVQHVPTNECNDPYSYDGQVLGETMFCAGVDGGGKDSCQGDSGGPIFTETNGRFTQVGVVSWGYGCAAADYPGVYSRISGAFDWIKDTICNDSATQYKPDFCDGSSPSPLSPSGPPAPSSGDSVVEVRLDMKFDNYPQETTWEFLQNGRVVATGEGAGERESAVVSYTYNVNSGSTVFRIRDSAGDGICCGYGSGKYEIVSVVGGRRVFLADSTGAFDDIEEKAFTIPDSGDFDSPLPTPSPTTRSPTPSPTSSPQTRAPTQPPIPSSSGCRDSTSEIFLVDSAAGNRGCNWLALNMDNYGYLCQFLDVAAKCKDTCNACSYFE